jgi:photosystem II stability/assembly factor-like uncharacterized protein
MATRDVGWGTAVGPSGQDLQMVVRTTDGGTSWRDVSPFPAHPMHITEWYFLDAQHAWIVVRPPETSNAEPVRVTVWHTADGGQTWTPGRPIAYVGDNLSGWLDFVDWQHGWYEINLGGGAGSWSDAVYQTGDGGLTWALISMNSVLQPELNTANPLPGPAQLAFADTQLGWATPYSVLGHTLATVLDVTRDGGRTWAPQPLPPATGPATTLENIDIEAEQPSLTSAAHGALFIFTPGDPELTKAAYVTDDGGQTWQINVFHHLDELQAQFIDDQTGWFRACDIRTGHYVLYSTRDGGKSWVPVPANFIPPGRLDFISRDLGWSWGANGGYRTDDGGRTWRLLHS